MESFCSSDENYIKTARYTELYQWFQLVFSRNPLQYAYAARIEDADGAHRFVTEIRKQSFRGPILLGMDCEFIQPKDLKSRNRNKPDVTYKDPSLPICKSLANAGIAWITIASPYGMVGAIYLLGVMREVFEIINRFLMEENIYIAAHNWHSDSFALSITFGPKDWQHAPIDWEKMIKDTGEYKSLLKHAQNYGYGYKVFDIEEILNKMIMDPDNKNDFSLHGLRHAGIIIERKKLAHVTSEVTGTDTTGCQVNFENGAERREWARPDIPLHYEQYLVSDALGVVDTLICLLHAGLL